MDKFFTGFEKQAERNRGPRGRYLPSQTGTGIDPNMAAAGTGLLGGGALYGGHKLRGRGSAIAERAQRGMDRTKRLHDVSVARSTNKYLDTADKLQRAENRVMRPKNLWQRITGKRDQSVGKQLDAIDRARSHTRSAASASEASAAKTMASRQAKLAPALQKGTSLKRIGGGIRGLGLGALGAAGLYGYNKLRQD